MTVGLKYCGGCNPYYERTKLAEKIKEQLKNHVTFEPLQEGKLYDVVVLICGCVRRCVTMGGIRAKYGVVYTTSEKDDAYVIDFIMDVYEKNQEQPKES